MRNLFFLLTAILLSSAAQAQSSAGNIETVGGIGGYADLTLPFRQGDKVTISANASKLLSSLVISHSGNKVLGRLKGLKKVSYTFVMPADDSVTFHFVSDRGGVNRISYNITTGDASAGTAAARK